MAYFVDTKQNCLTVFAVDQRLLGKPIKNIDEMRESRRVARVFLSAISMIFHSFWSFERVD